MKLKQVKQIITEEEILADLTKDEDKKLMVGLKQIKFIEDLESVLKKLPFLKKLVSSKSEESQLTKELLNRINYIRKADDFKYKIDEKDIKKPIKKAFISAKEKVGNSDLKVVHGKEEFLKLIKQSNGVFFYKDEKRTFKKFDRDGDIQTKEDNIYFKHHLEDNTISVPIHKVNKEKLKPDTSENLLKKYKENKDKEVEDELKQIEDKREKPQKEKTKVELKVGDKVIIPKGTRYNTQEDTTLQKREYQLETKDQYSGVIEEIKYNLAKVTLDNLEYHDVIYLNKNNLIKAYSKEAIYRSMYDKQKTQAEMGSGSTEQTSKKPKKAKTASSGPG